MFEPDTPVRTEAELVAHVRESVGTAIRRQTWLFLFDDEDRPLPVLIPIDGMPIHPDAYDLGVLAERLRDLADETGAASIALVWERPGRPVLRPQDLAWVAGMHESAAPIRAQLLSSDDGVRLLDPASEAGAEAAVA